MNRFLLAFLAILLLAPACACAQTLAERFESSAKRDRPSAIAWLEKRIEDRKSLFEAAKRGPIDQPKNDYSLKTAPDGQKLHNFFFRTAADRKEIAARYQKQLSDATRDLKDIKAETAWPCLTKSLREIEVGDFLLLDGAYRIALRESSTTAWIEKTSAGDSECFHLSAADFSRYADGKEIDFQDAKAPVLFRVEGTRTKPDALRTLSSTGQTLYELEMISLDDLNRQLPQGVRILIIGAPADDDEKDLPTPSPAKK